MLQDGRLLLTGGGSTVNKTDAYNPSTDTWTSLANMPRERTGHATVLLADGRVMVIAGCWPMNYCSTEATTTLYNLSTNSWATGPNLSGARLEPAAVRLNNGKVLVVGGQKYSGAYHPVTPIAELFDPSTNSFGPVAPMQVSARHVVTATKLNNGKVLVTGGATTAEVYEPATGTWSATGTAQKSHLPQGRPAP